MKTFFIAYLIGIVVCSFIVSASIKRSVGKKGGGEARISCLFIFLLSIFWPFFLMAETKRRIITLKKKGEKYE